MTSTIESKEQEIAVALHTRLASIIPSAVPIVSKDRNIPRKEQAKLARQLFKSLGLHGISVTAPNYSMAQTVDVNLPKRRDYILNARGMIADHANDPAAQANCNATNQIRAILTAAFPNHDDRSDSMTDYFDSCWSFN